MSLASKININFVSVPTTLTVVMFLILLQKDVNRKRMDQSHVQMIGNLYLLKVLSSSLMKSENYELCPHYSDQCLAQDEMFTEDLKVSNYKNFLHKPT